MVTWLLLYPLGPLDGFGLFRVAMRSGELGGASVGGATCLYDPRVLPRDWRWVVTGRDSRRGAALAICGTARNKINKPYS